jgi:hypothetical protein
VNFSFNEVLNEISKRSISQFDLSHLQEVKFRIHADFVASESEKRSDN